MGHKGSSRHGNKHGHPIRRDDRHMDSSNASFSIVFLGEREAVWRSLCLIVVRYRRAKVFLMQSMDSSAGGLCVRSLETERHIRGLPVTRTNRLVQAERARAQTVEESEAQRIEIIYLVGAASMKTECSSVCFVYCKPFFYCLRHQGLDLSWRRIGCLYFRVCTTIVWVYQNCWNITFQDTCCRKGFLFVGGCR